MRRLIIITVFLTFVSGMFMSRLDAGQSIPLAPENAIISYDVQNYYPPGFRGRPRLTPYSVIVVRLEAFKDGKLVNLSDTDISWYLNDKRLKGGRGLKELTVPVTDNAGGSVRIRAYADTGAILIEKALSLTIEKPYVVLETPYSNNQVPATDDVVLLGVPYFFTAPDFKNLNFSWKVDGREYGRSNDNQLALRLGQLRSIKSLTRISVDLLVQNIQNILEFARVRKTLTVIP